jgi:hypothetical protein
MSQRLPFGQTSSSLLHRTGIRSRGAVLHPLANPVIRAPAQQRIHRGLLPFHGGRGTVGFRAARSSAAVNVLVTASALWSRMGAVLLNVDSRHGSPEKPPAPVNLRVGYPMARCTWASSESELPIYRFSGRTVTYLGTPAQPGRGDCRLRTVGGRVAGRSTPCAWQRRPH